MYCAQCKHYQASPVGLPENASCMHEQSKYTAGGIVDEPTDCLTTCEIMLKSVCKDHRLWEERKNG